MTKKQLEDHALPSLALIFGYIAVKELDRLEDRVAVLDRLGYGNAEIAKICDTTLAKVRALRGRVRLKAAKKNKRSPVRTPNFA